MGCSSCNGGVIKYQQGAAYVVTQTKGSRKGVIKKSASEVSSDKGEETPPTSLQPVAGEPGPANNESEK